MFRIRNHRRGMTLVEIVLSIGILGIIAVMMTPVFTGAFLQITTGGSRNQTDWQSAAELENILAGQTTPGATDGPFTFILPGSQTVSTNRFTSSLTSEDGSVDINLFLPVTTPATTLSPTPALTSTPTPSTTPTPALSPTAAPTPASIVDPVTVDPIGWTNENKWVILKYTTNDMQYSVSTDSGSFSNYRAGSTGQTINVTVSDNSKDWYIKVRSKYDYLVFKIITIRKAPAVELTGNKNNTSSYFRWISDENPVIESNGISYYNGLNPTEADGIPIISSANPILNRKTSTNIVAWRIADASGIPSLPTINLVP